MGKLLPQDPNDEPASELLKKIAGERAQLLKKKKIRKQKSQPPISNTEISTQAPSGWAYCRLNDIIQISSGDGLTSAKMAENGTIPVYGGNGVNGYHDKSNVNKITLTIGRVGYYCGAIHITPEHAWVTDNAFITTFSEENIYLEFLAWLLKGTDLKADESATAQPVISGRKLYPIIVCLPPLAEQHRIVVKVEELMALCDRLKAGLQTAQTTQLHLANTLVETAIK
jgi:type I restriction enzyme S subunit